MKREDKIMEMHELIKELFPDAVSVKVFVNSQGIEVEPQFKTNISGYSMQTITGQWVSKNK